MDDALLASELREARIARLMQTHGNAVLRVCYAYLKDAQLAEDAAQDAFLKAYRHLDGLPSAEDYREKTWLLRIAANTCKDYRRSAWFRHVDRTVSADDLAVSRAAMLPDERQLWEDVMALAPRHRMVVVLRYYQDMSADDIALALGVSRATVYARLKQAQSKLRAALEGEYHHG